MNIIVYLYSVYISSCTYKGEACNISRDFVTTMTDLGVCYTFNSGKTVEPLEVTESGIKEGIRIQQF